MGAGAGCRTHQKLRDGYGSMLWHESVGHNRILATSAAQTHSEPIVLEFDVINRQQKESRFWRVLLRFVRDHTPEHEPPRVITSSGESPGPRKAIAAIDGDHLADLPVRAK